MNCRDRQAALPVTGGGTTVSFRTSVGPKPGNSLVSLARPLTPLVEEGAVSPDACHSACAGDGFVMSSVAKPATIIGQVGHFHSAYDSRGWRLEDSVFMPVDGVVSDVSIEEWAWPSEGAYTQVTLIDEFNQTHCNELSALHFGLAATCPQQRPQED